MEENEYSITIKAVKQISEHEFDIYPIAMKATDATTVGDIAKWIRCKYRLPEDSKVDFTVVQLELPA